MQEGVEFVRCRICGLESGSLARHIGTHNMTAEQYRSTYTDAKVVADVVRETKNAKLMARPKKEIRLICKYCGGLSAGRVQLYHHEKNEERIYLQGIVGKEFLVCRECGYRSPMLSQHIKLHEMTDRDYLVKYPEAELVLKSIVDKISASNRAKGGYKPMSEKRGAMECGVCGEWYQPETAQSHRQVCVAAYPNRYIEGKDYLKCPECGEVLMRIGKHLIRVHGWSKDKLCIEVNKGLKLTAEVVRERWVDGQNFAAAQTKREQTHLDRHGYTNPFSDPSVQDKIVDTNQRRYGVDHAMKNEEVFIRQTESAQRGPSEQERFFDEHTCPNVVWNGYGGRFIRTKTGVHKFGRLIKDMCPDFIVLSSNVLESALIASKEHKRMDRQKHRSRYVIELLGDYYHSEKVIGVKPEEHEKEIIEAYKSAKIECLVLWEKDVMTRWEAIRPMVDAWVEKAVKDMNERPIFSRATKNRVDRRKGDLITPDGSGRKFKTHRAMDKWIASPLNYWKQGLVEGKDYVICLECNDRAAKLTEHLRRSHNMTREQYEVLHPSSPTMSQKAKEIASRGNLGKKRGDYIKHTVYRCPDGSIVGKRDTWLRAWDVENPPIDSIVDGSLFNSRHAGLKTPETITASD